LPVALAIVLWWRYNRSRNTEEFSAAGQVFGTVPVAEKTIVANPLEALR
jgi:Na+/proline symporter